MSILQEFQYQTDFIGKSMFIELDDGKNFNGNLYIFDCKNHSFRLRFSQTNQSIDISMGHFSLAMLNNQRVIGV